MASGLTYTLSAIDSLAICWCDNQNVTIVTRQTTWKINNDVMTNWFFDIACITTFLLSSRTDHKIPPPLAVVGYTLLSSPKLCPFPVSPTKMSCVRSVFWQPKHVTRYSLSSYSSYYFEQSFHVCSFYLLISFSVVCCHTVTGRS